MCNTGEIIIDRPYFSGVARWNMDRNVDAVSRAGRCPSRKTISSTWRTKNEKPAAAGFENAKGSVLFCRNRCVSFGDRFCARRFCLSILFCHMLDVLDMLLCMHFLVLGYLGRSFCWFCGFTGSFRFGGRCSCGILSVGDACSSEQGGDKKCFFHLMLSFVLKAKETFLCYLNNGIA